MLYVEKDSLGGDKMKKDKKVIFLICLTLGMLAYNLFFSAIQLTDYNKRKASGDAHWLMVEERILDIENEVNTLKDEFRIFNNIE
jgi:hypothetical protein